MTPQRVGPVYDPVIDERERAASGCRVMASTARSIGQAIMGRFPDDDHGGWFMRIAESLELHADVLVPPPEEPVGRAGPGSRRSGRARLRVVR